METFKIKRIRLQGYISRTTNRGFGFIHPTSMEQEIFFHAAELIDTEYNDLNHDDLVEFEVFESSRGPSAINIERDGSGRDVFDDEVSQVQDEEKEKSSGPPIAVLVGQLSKSLIQAVANNPAVLNEVEWRDLERMIAEIFAKFDCAVTLTRGSKDGGKDVIVDWVENGQQISYIIEVKHWVSGKTVGANDVSNFIHIVGTENRTGGLFLASSGYRELVMESVAELRTKSVFLGGKEKIIKMCQRYVIKAGMWTPSSSLHEIIRGDTY